MRTRLVPVAIAAATFAALSVASVFVFRGMAERNRLVSRNDGERTLNILFAALRDYDDFGSAIEGTESLRKKVIGLGVYAEQGGLLHSWGAVPDTYAPPAFSDPDIRYDMARAYVENARNSSLIVLLRPARDGRPPPPPQPEKSSRRGPPFIVETLRRADLVYLEVLQPGFWRRARTLAVLFPVTEAALAGLVAFILMLILRNAEYRRRIEEQRNLVVLGNAASTLAHEIKNPLLAIRLQTSILSRTLPGGPHRELGIIDDEVERLSMLSHKVNDFLRDPAGQPARTDVREIAAEVGQRLCARRIVDAAPGSPPSGAAHVLIDPERLRSVMENLLRNALESGGTGEGIAVEIGRQDGMVVIDVLDRGSGIPAAARQRLFDPFYTTKSRGSGIGLPICRRFVEAAGGTIALEDRPGGGSRARVVLPEAPPANGEGALS